MSKTLTLFLATTPYSGQNTETVLRLAAAAVRQGHQVNVFASGDGVHNFTTDQGARSVPNAEAGFAPLIADGLHVELCGTCLRFRGIRPEQHLAGAGPSSMKRLFALVAGSDVFLSFGS